ncbi:SLC13 family permease [Candidatus Oscillochloris fontis]|uniref:SLC13 family permease n=1 Tax=Candidatus Oscillochloris fontis TaxID=2496868 RepID=UPI00101CBD6C|nr:SLC13 family permease [Candidatus Oscillochloris fontis]
MTIDILIVFGILAGTIALFISDRLRLDLVALLALLALLLTGILTPAQAVAGFGDTTVILIAALFVVGDGLFQTGVANAMGRWLGRVAGTNELRILVMTMLVVAPLSAFISSTGTVAIMMPVAVSLARRAGFSPSRILIPMAYAALIGGMLTLIGTPPNLVVSNALVSAGHAPLGFFSFMPVGLMILVVGVLFMALVGRKLVPARINPDTSGSHRQVSLAQLSSEYLLLPDSIARLRVNATSPLISRNLAESGLRTRYGATVVAVQPWPIGRAAPEHAQPAHARTQLRAGDLIEVQIPAARVAELVREQDLAQLQVDPDAELLNRDLHIIEVALTPRSRFIDRTIREINVRNTFNVTVLGIRRLGKPLAGDLAQIELQFGDTLLVAGSSAALAPVVQEQRYFGDFVVASIPRELEERFAEAISPRWPIAVAIMLIMLVAMVLGWLPTMTVALLAAVAMVLSGCVPIAGVYRRMSWESLILIAAMLPMSTALQETGGAALIASSLSSTLGAMGPLALMAGIFVLTSLFSQFISNTATAVLLAPIALEASLRIGVNPEPLLVATALAASTAFATPIATPVNTLVLTPGGYRFSDYARAGLPLQILILGVCLVAVPFFFPF